MRKIIALCSIVLLMMQPIFPFVVQASVKDREEIKVSETTTYEYTIHYYRYDGNAADWDMWVYADGIDGAAYELEDKGKDFAKATFTYDTESINLITRLGDWEEQEMDRLISIPENERHVEVWIIEGDETVYYEKPAIIPEKPTNNYIQFEYERHDKDYEDWNIWVWNTGVKDDQIDFHQIDDNALAFIEVGKNIDKIGFKLRKGDDWETVDVDEDREIIISPLETVTKVKVTENEYDYKAIPFISKPSISNNTILFYYRDEQLFIENEMDRIDGVELVINDEIYRMVYEKENERYIYELEGLTDGNYEYYFKVTIDGEEKEVADLYNLTDEGKSFVNLSSSELRLEASFYYDEIDYHEQNVLMLDVEGELDAIADISVDLTAIGGKEAVPMDPELLELSVAVAEETISGEKVIPIKVTDKYGQTHETSASLFVKEAERPNNDFDWDEARIYFMLTDRFADGSTANNFEPSYNSAEPGAYHGGDFKGLTDRLDYLEELGINTIWITPIVENIGYDVAYDNTDANGLPYYSYHGYWASNFEKLNPHLGSLAEFHNLIDEAAERDIKIMVDVVLNHTGYGLKEIDGDIANPPEGYPTNEDRNRFKDMVRQDGGNPGNEVTGELSGLPDFITEKEEVRQQLVDWQTSWIEKATTSKGNTIDYYRVDTVKHVDDTTWQHFKNELIKKKPNFKLIGEAWGASANNSSANHYLNSGMMDSLLDFQFKEIARDLVNGDLEMMDNRLKERTMLMDNKATMGQFLGSHDEDGFLHFINDETNTAKLKIAASLQILSKGQAVIYYGEELGLSGENNWPLYDNRYDFPWDLVEDNDVHHHYKQLLNLRKNHSKLFSKGAYKRINTRSNEDVFIFQRDYDNQAAIVAINPTDDEQKVTIDTPFAPNETITEEYVSKEFVTNEKGEISLTIPAKSAGGTVILIADKGEENGSIDEEESKSLRIHYQNTSNQYDNLGLWLWDDVKTASEELDSWPKGASLFPGENRTAYGAYIDVPLKEDASQVSFLVVDRVTGNKDGEDKTIELFSPNIDEVWVQEGSDKVHLVEPIELDSNVIRIHYETKDNNYDRLGIWTWDDVVAPSTEWPEGADEASGIGNYGAYYDIHVMDDANKIGFLFLDKDSEEKTIDYTIDDLSVNQFFVKEGDEYVNTHPFGGAEVMLRSGEVLSDTQIELSFSSTSGLDMAGLSDQLKIIDSKGDQITIQEMDIVDDRKVVLKGQFDLDKLPYTVTYKDNSIRISGGWKMIDEMYAYDGELGAILRKDGSALIKLWSPKADHVSLILYDKHDQDKVIKDNIPLTLGDKGVWEVVLNEETTGLKDLENYYYHYEISHGDQTNLALDPYAKSLAKWANPESGGKYPIAKAAIVGPSKVGPSLNYADIEGYETREDAVIYEVHVRDFTSDPSIDDELLARFGTFAAFIEKLDYIESLGVTHIQLLPVMSYYFANEWKSDERLLDWSSSGTNYNWGYDPQSYFSLTGMYSENPDDPQKRIEEFKQLINEIHKRGMGVTLDVVYNHTAKMDIFENLVPNYYHFMDADGTPRESFGGGRLGTTHEMSRRILVDSILYWVEEFKVDGFRFDMMGDHDAESIQQAYDLAKELNPNILMIGEGWVTYVGDEGDSVMPADQQWMQYTESVGSFSDEFRNELKSGFGSEGQPRFITGGKRNIQQIFDNLRANPHNFKATNPGDVVPYIAAHDNLTLHDVIAQSIQKDPEYHQDEIHKRIRLGNLMVLTAQGTPFIHAGQEFGRTKQFRSEVQDAPYKSTYMTDESGNPFTYPYFIHDSYDSTDAVNMFDWDKATNEELYPINVGTKEFTRGMIHLRRSTDAFSHKTMEDISNFVTLIDAPEIEDEDLLIAYQARSSDQTETFYVFINADHQDRKVSLNGIELINGDVLVDQLNAGTEPIANPMGVEISEEQITLGPLTAAIVRVVSDNKSEDDEVNDNVDEGGQDDLEGDESADNSDDNSIPEAGKDTDSNSANEDKDSMQDNTLPKTATYYLELVLVGIVLCIFSLLVLFRARGNSPNL